MVISTLIFSSKSSKSRRSHEGVKAPVPVPKTSLSQEDLDSLPPVAKIPKTQPPVDAEISSDSEPEVNTLPAVNGDLQVTINSNSIQFIYLDSNKTCLSP